jgi:hypothetical protein
MSDEVIEATEVFKTTSMLAINKLMAKIIFFWCLEKKNLNRMMEFQMKFCHHSELRLWRTEMLLLTKSKGHNSNGHCQWTYRYLFYSLKFHFERPSKAFICTFQYEIHQKLGQYI